MDNTPTDRENYQPYPPPTLMETAARTARSSAANDSGSSVVLDWGAIATWLLAALPVVYLSLENGGYDSIPRDQIGIAVWWLLMLGVAAGALPAPGRTRVGLVALGLLFGFACWTALAFIWTESAERTATELARVATYLGIFALSICLVTRRRAAARHVLAGVTFALALVAAIGVLSRFHLDWFPPNELERLFPGIEIARRLSYPLNYSSAMGALAGMTFPLVLAATGAARTIAVQALAAAAFPIVGLTLYLATSGTGVAVAIVATLTFFALAPDRFPKLLTFLAGAGGAAILAVSVAHRAALARGLPTPAAEHQGTEMIWLSLAVCLAVGLIQAGIGLAGRRKPPCWLQVGRKHTFVATGALVVVAIAIAIATGLPGKASHRWENFTSLTPTRGGGSSPSTAIDFKGNGRYQFWVSAVEANETAPWTGIGPGAFEFWWARRGSFGIFIRDAHSLYFENLAELGIVGLLLIAGFVLLIIGIGTVRSLRAPPDQRLVLAAVTAGAAGFAMATGLDWVWEIGALPIAFMPIAAVAVCGYSVSETVKRRDRTRLYNCAVRLLVAAIAIAVLAVIWFPLRGATALEQSQIDAADGDHAAALDQARNAADAQPYAASPFIQQALILEQQHRLSAAAAATRKESTNWRTWITLSRMQGERGKVNASIHAYERARALNPKSAMWDGH